MGLIERIMVSLHVVLCVFYAWDWYREKEEIEEAAFRLAVSLCVPVLGFLFLQLIDYFTRKTPDAERLERIYMEETGPGEDFALLRPVDKGLEMERIPVEEALRMGEYSLRRRMVMETLKREDTEEYLDVLKKALDNDDTETSHYASAVIMDVQKRVQESLMQREAAFEKEPENDAVLHAFEAELYRVISGKLFDELNMQKYYVKYKLVSDALLKKKEPERDSYHHRLRVDFATEDYVHAGELCTRFEKEYPDSEDMVVDTIELCVKTKDRAHLDRFLAGLGSLPVMLTEKSLPYIRFFGGGEDYVGVLS